MNCVNCPTVLCCEIYNVVNSLIQDSLKNLREQSNLVQLNWPVVGTFSWVAVLLPD